ncbi:hypothetical protein LSAT2_011850 [Lamellibrachia satsuma]|nr:hypothetical protein LSAT2_011850 [Lamellibrachia satsuma]
MLNLDRPVDGQDTQGRNLTSLTTVGRMQSVVQESSGNPTPGSRPPSAVVAGDGTAPPLGDKELNDLLDFSAMFSPPVPGGAVVVRNVPTTIPNNYPPGYKPVSQPSRVLPSDIRHCFENGSRHINFSWRYTVSVVMATRDNGPRSCGKALYMSPGQVTLAVSCDRSYNFVVPLPLTDRTFKF